MLARFLFVTLFWLTAFSGLALAMGDCPNDPIVGGFNIPCDQLKDFKALKFIIQEEFIKVGDLLPSVEAFIWLPRKIRRKSSAFIALTAKGLEHFDLVVNGIEVAVPVADRIPRAGFKNIVVSVPAALFKPGHNSIVFQAGLFDPPFSDNVYDDVTYGQVILYFQ